MFEPKLFDEMIIDGKDSNAVIAAMLKCCHQFIFAYDKLDNYMIERFNERLFGR